MFVSDSMPCTKAPMVWILPATREATFCSRRSGVSTNVWCTGERTPTRYVRPRSCERSRPVQGSPTLIWVRGATPSVSWSESPVPPAAIVATMAFRSPFWNAVLIFLRLESDTSPVYA